MPEFVVSARKYRPVRFDEVVGQQHVSQTLKNALRQGRLAHAFLFCGPRGVGKTTNARILAKVLNCLDVGEDYEPCNKCTNCVSFNQNASFNIFELDGASNNKVESMHQLMEQVRIPPQDGNKKVYIIDEVHMLTTSAFNAFLKTLEEPPDYAVFILATTEKHKILPTILSRCQVYDFHRIRPADMVDHLQEICAEEGIAAEQEALHLVAEKADGALRDALSIFDRVISSGDTKTLTYRHAAEQLNVLDHSTFFSITESLLVEDAAGLYVTFDEILSNGFEPEPFLTGLASHLRQLFVCKSSRTLGLIEVSDALRERYAEQASRCSPSFLVNALNLAAECDFRLRQASNKRLHVELYLVKMAYAQRTVSREFVAAPANASAAAAPSAAPPQKKSVAPSVAPSVPAPPATHTLSPTELREPAPDAAAELGTVECAPTPEASPAPQAEAVAQALPASPPPPVAAPVPAPAKPAPAKKALPKLTPSISFNDDEEEDAEEVDIVPASSISFSTLEKAWLDSASKQSNTVEGFMKGAKLTFDCPTLRIRVGSAMALNTLRGEAMDVRTIKTKLRCPELNITFELDEALAPKEAPKKVIIGPKEQYQKLLAVNPEVDSLRRRLGLEYEE